MKDIKLLELCNKNSLEQMKRNNSQEKFAEKIFDSICAISDIESGITDIRYTNLLRLQRLLI